MENVFAIFKKGRYKDCYTKDLSTQHSTLTPTFSTTRSYVLPTISKESHNPGSPSCWLNTQEKHETSLVHKIAARFVPKQDFTTSHNHDDLSTQHSTLTPTFSTTRSYVLPTSSSESHNPGSPSCWLNTQGEHETSLVQKIAARFVPKQDFHTSHKHDVQDGRSTPLSRGGNRVKQRHLFKASEDCLDTNSPTEGFISKVAVQQLMSFKKAPTQNNKQTSVKNEELSRNWSQMEKGEKQSETREELSRKGEEPTRKGEESTRKGEESLKKWAEFARKGMESGKREQPMLGLLVLVWLINQREILKDLAELRNKSINGQKILHSTQDIANTSLMKMAQQMSSLHTSIQEQQQQVHTQMTHLKRLVLLCSVVQLILLVSMVTWTNPSIRGRLYNWYRYIKVSVPPIAVSLLATCKDTSQRLLHRFTSKFTEMTYGWCWR